MFATQPVYNAARPAHALRSDQNFIPDIDHLSVLSPGLFSALQVQQCFSYNISVQVSLELHLYNRRSPQPQTWLAPHRMETQCPKSALYSFSSPQLSDGFFLFSLLLYFFFLFFPPTHLYLTLPLQTKSFKLHPPVTYTFFLVLEDLSSIGVMLLQ